jgi:hypothetical protein
MNAPTTTPPDCDGIVKALNVLLTPTQRSELAGLLRQKADELREQGVAGHSRKPARKTHVQSCAQVVQVDGARSCGDGSR